jgi:hypothetical protein
MIWLISCPYEGPRSKIELEGIQCDFGHHFVWQRCF